MKCSNYNQLGHPAYRCPEKLSSSNYDKRLAYSQEDNASFNETYVDHIESKKGKILMYRRVQIKQPTPNEPRNRRALFKTKCKILGKVCKVVVDSRSIDTIILEEAMANLKLRKIPHDNFYKVTWLNKGKSILVNEQAWV